MDIDIKELKTITVLYVEDEQLIREQISNMFNNLFKKVYVACDGEEALEYYKKTNKDLDVIISDINMPGMTGLELAEELQTKFCNEIPIVLTTAHTDEDFLLKSFELSISKYVTKPLKIKDLSNVVIEVVNKYRKHQKLELATKALVNQTKNTIQEHEKLKIHHDINEKELNYNKDIIDGFISFVKVDSKGLITNASQRFLLTYNFTKDEIVNKSISDFTQENSLLQKMMLQATKEKKSKQFKLNFTIKDKKEVCFDNLIIPRYESDSQYVSGYDLYQTVSF